MKSNMLPAAPVEFRKPICTKDGTLDVVYDFPKTAHTWVQTGTEVKSDEFGNLETIPVGVFVLDPRLITADDFTAIDRHCCRVCHRFIRPYNSFYMQDVSSYGSRSLFRMDYGNNYCEDCAKKLSSRAYGNGINRSREVTYDRENGKVTYIASAGWHGDPYYDPDAMIIESSH